MNETQATKAQPDNAQIPHDNINLIDWLIALARRKKLVLGMPVLFVVCAALASLAMPNIYKASTTILPSQQPQSSAAAMLNQLGGFAGTTLGAFSITIPIELYVSMLKSSTVADNLIQRFDLKRGYGTEGFEATRQALARNSRIKFGKDGLIVIEVEDTDPSRAAQIANGYVDELLKLINRMALTEASHRRLFYERALQSTKAKLAEVQVALKQASDSRAVKAGDSHSQAVADTVASLRAQISAKEVRLGVMQAFVTVNNQEYIRAQQEIGAMNAELARIENSNPSVRGLGRPAQDQVGSAEIKIRHDIKYYELLHELLAKQHDAALLDEAKDKAIIEVLDKAVAPERSFKPKRSGIVISAALFGLLIAMFGVLLFDVIRIGQRAGEAQQFEKLKRYLRFRR
jgi:tyrosine-protein kinase Etk/Wzc